jgi:transcriptional repressor NrdR
MINFVVKKDGTREPFDPEKIKRGIRAATRQANLPEQRTITVVEEVFAKVLQSLEGKEEVPSLALRDMILNELDVVEPAASAAWREYDQKRHQA